MGSWGGGGGGGAHGGVMGNTLAPASEVGGSNHGLNHIRESW